MVPILATSDLPQSIRSHELVAAMVAGANAKAFRVAPCLTWAGSSDEEPAPTTEQVAEAKLILIGAVKRWAEAGSGALQQEAAGIFSHTVDTRQRTGFNLWPSEITGLQDICAAGGEAKAYAVDTVSDGALHAEWCSLYFGATYCSCGADIAGVPIFEQV